MKNKWYIKHFDDYHSIRSKSYKYQELGCFPTKEDFGYNRYFGLFFKGKRPTLKKILKSLSRKVQFDNDEYQSIHYRTGKDIGITKDDFIYEISEAIKHDPNQPDDHDDY